MSVSYEWSFPTLDIAYNKDGHENVVTVVHWRLAANDDAIYATAYGTVNLAPPGQPFIQYEDLTSDIVRAWTEDAMGSDALAETKASLAREIESKKHPKGGSVPPPWDPTVA